MKQEITIVLTEVMKWNPQWDRFECNLSDLGWESIPDTFVLFNPNSRIQEILTKKSTCYEGPDVSTWRYESDRYTAVIKNI